MIVVNKFTIDWVEIITVGNEVVSGRTVNSNATNIARRMQSLGFTINRVTSVRDEEDEIVDVITSALRRKNKVIIITGGLGPTYDDITSQSLAKALNRKLEQNVKALEQIKEKYRKRNLELTPERIKMAFIPEGAQPVDNNKGIAPGIYVNVEGVEILATPGVPSEMEDVLENFIRSFLKYRPAFKYYEANLEVQGVMESAIAPHIAELVKKYFPIYIKTHPQGKELEKPVLRIQIALSSDNEMEAKKKIEDSKRELLNVIHALHGTVTDQGTS
ncbi:competence protein ComA [Sulfolobales archaeon HS-7]|nr:competence protein ComA [Sulfolobales archaeon HS-7]